MVELWLRFVKTIKRKQDEDYQNEIRMVAQRTREQSIAEFQKGQNLSMTPAGNIIDVTEPKRSEKTHHDEKPLEQRWKILKVASSNLPENELLNNLPQKMKKMALKSTYKLSSYLYHHAP
jgi:hypothetical protein